MSETIYDSEAARLRPGATASVTRENAARLAAPATTPSAAVRWGPIVAGFLVALGTFVLLSLLLLALGASAVRIGPDVPGDDAVLGIGAATAIAGLVSFLLGGFLASRTAGIRGSWSGFLTGFLVWALGLLAILAFTAFGIGSLFGEAGSLIGRFGALAQALPEGMTADQAIRAVRDAALPAFLSMALPAAAAGLGGLIGAQEDLGFEVRRRNEARVTGVAGPDRAVEVRQ
jgi:hypothetical protein